MTVRNHTYGRRNTTEKYTFPTFTHNNKYNNSCT